MIALLNYLPWIVLLVAFAALFKWPEHWPKITVAAAIALVVLAALTPSYVPKGQASGAVDDPEFETIELPLNNVLREPTEEELKQFEERADWKKRVREEPQPGGKRDDTD